MSEQLNLRLVAHGASKYLAFGAGEKRLSQWLEANAGLSWIVHPQPWLIKKTIIQQYLLPLNIKGNDHPFRVKLEGLRERARLQAHSHDARNG